MNTKQIIGDLKNLVFKTAMVVPDNLYAQFTYFTFRHQFLNLKHPKTFDEKIWWLKFHYFNPLMTQCCDKWRVRRYVEDCGLKNILNPVFGHWSTFEDIDINSIPDEDFYLKVNHVSGGNRLCHKSSFMKDKEALRHMFNYWLSENYYYHGREYCYKHVKPCILAEKVLRPSNKHLYDYKFLCFEGEPRLLLLDIGVANADGSHAKEYYRNIYDMNFLPMKDMRETRDFYHIDEIEKPVTWDFMIECCRKLSKPFPHCRVDLYSFDGKVYFGEITFFHGSGCNHFSPKESDLKLGSWIPLDHSYPKKY